MSHDTNTNHPTIYTIGHSTRPIEEFIGLLKQNGVTLLADIRTIPKSRHNPQYWGDELERSLKKAGIRYVYLKDLGGLRPKVTPSTNTAWRNASFRNYADYMQTDQFAAAVEGLIELSSKQNTAIMCAEAVPWRCHRSLVADALMVHGYAVYDIISDSEPKPSRLTQFAVVDGVSVRYPGE